MELLSMGIVPAAVAAVVGLILGFGLGNRGKGDLSRRTQHLEDQLERATVRAREQTTALASARTEAQSVASLVRFLPSIVAELNQPELEIGHVPKLIVRLAAALFEPEQVLFYMVRKPREGSGQPELYLRYQRGIREVPDAAAVIPFGQGKIGWVAANRVEMSQEDWRNASRTDGQAFETRLPGIALDLIGPVVQGSRVLGVIVVGKPKVRPRDEKLTLQMVTNLGAVALSHAMNLSSVRNDANKDGLTGLYNKRYLMKALGEMIRDAEQSGQPLSLFLFDIDHFKVFNDTQGHQAGDVLLKELSALVASKCGKEALVARYGGEEFVVVMPGTPPERGIEKAEAIRAAIAGHPFAHRESQPLGVVSISGGVAGFPTDGTSAATLLEFADQALYEAKRATRNKVLRYRGVTIGVDPDVPVELPAAEAGAVPGAEGPHR